MSSIEHIKYFQKIIGQNNVLTQEEDKISYETPWRGEKGNAFCVLLPKNTEDVSKILAYVSKKNIPFICQSGNTGLVGASTPDQSSTQLLISLKRLNKIINVNIINKSAHVEAGVLLSKLNESLLKEELFFPIDLSSDPCIGGMVATNTGGSRLLKYGGVRENLLGLKVVLPDENGTILDLSNELHKNNTGLDQKQLFVGTGCQNGIITECIVKLSAIPKQRATALIIPKNIEKISELLKNMEQKFGQELSAFEGISKNALEAVFKHNPNIKNRFNGGIPEYICLIELSRQWETRTHEASLEDVLQTELEGIMEGNNNLINDVLFGTPEDHWNLRHAVSESVQKSGKLISFDISFTRDKMMVFRQYIEQKINDEFPNITICDFGHIGDGAMHLNLVVNPNDRCLKDNKFIPSLREWVLNIVINEFKGSFSAEHGIGPINQHMCN